jgi:hypothetical protein
MLEAQKAQTPVANRPAKYARPPILTAEMSTSTQVLAVTSASDTKSGKRVRA